MTGGRDQIDVVVDQQHLSAAKIWNADDDVAQVLGLAFAQARARLVHHDDARLRHDAARDLDKPPLAGIERNAHALRLPGHADIVERFADEIAPRAAPGRHVVERRGDVVPDTEIFDHLLGLECAPQAERGAAVHRDAQQILAVDRDRAGRAPDKAAHDVEQRGFAGAVRPDQSGDLGPDIGGEIVEAAHAAELDREAADLDHSFRSMIRGIAADSFAPTRRLERDDLAGYALRRGDQRVKQARPRTPWSPDCRRRANR